MDDRLLRVVRRTVNKQLPLMVDDERTQVIPLKFDDELLDFEQTVKGFFPMRVGDEVQMFLNDWIVHGTLTRVDHLSNRYQFRLSNVEEFARRNFVRVETFLRAVCVLSDDPDNQDPLDIYFFDSEFNYDEFRSKNKEKRMVSMYVVDLSGGGVGLKTSHYFERGQEFNVHYREIGDVHASIQHIRVDRRSRELMYRVGLMYTEITERHRERIISYVFKLLKSKLK
jgi:hypothetical protein